MTTNLPGNTTCLSWNGKKMFYRFSKDGIYESSDNNSFNKAYSYIDTLNSHSTKGIFGAGSTKFEDSQNFKVNNREYVVYKFLQEETGQEPSVSYFSVELGFFLKYYLHSGSKLILCNNDVFQLIEKMKKDENFTNGMFKQNPKKNLKEYLPKK